MEYPHRLISYTASFKDFKKTDGFNYDNVEENAIVMLQPSVAEECAKHFLLMNPDLEIAWPVLFEISDNSPFYHFDSPSLWLVDFDHERYSVRKVEDHPG